jgi:HSP20 family protein
LYGRGETGPYNSSVTFGRDLERLRSEMDEVFSDLWHARRLMSTRRGWRPAADVYRTEDPPVVTVVCDLAGVDPADVELSVSEGIPSITGVRRRPAADRAVYHQIELDYGAFERRIPVGEEVDSGAAEAVYERGLLTVRLPLVQQPARTARVLIAVVRRP